MWRYGTPVAFSRAGVKILKPEAGRGVRKASVVRARTTAIRRAACLGMNPP
jgi:hypothetical protein